MPIGTLETKTSSIGYRFSDITRIDLVEYVEDNDTIIKHRIRLTFRDNSTFHGVPKTLPDAEKEWKDLIAQWRNYA